MQLSSLLGHTQELLSIIRNSDKPADSLIDSFFRSHKYLGSHDRRFIAQTVYGTLRHLRRSEAVLFKSLAEDQGSIGREDGALMIILAYLLNIEQQTAVSLQDVLPRVKSSQIKSHLEKVLQILPKVGEIETNDAVERLGVRYSFPNWMVERFLRQYGEEETEQICKSLNEQATLTLRVNMLKTTVEECEKALRAEGVETQRSPLSPFGLTVPKRINIFQLQAFREGFFEVQDEGSQLLPLILDPKPNARVLDVCAGAGGKTLEFAALMKNRGEILATDIHRYRLKELQKRSRRAGAFNVRVKEIDEVRDLEQNYTSAFDVVFVDAPCSGLGTIRRNPGMKWMVTEQTVRELAEKQLHITESSAPLVKSGGLLVYATCTFLRDENEGVVEQFLQKHSDFTIVDPSTYLTKWNLTALADQRYIKLLPHRNGTDGFFCAILQKR